ncbi:hypothetical protein ABPG72_006638 [Tetrahymena utriculariae]
MKTPNEKMQIQEYDAKQESYLRKSNQINQLISISSIQLHNNIKEIEKTRTNNQKSQYFNQNLIEVNLKQKQMFGGSNKYKVEKKGEDIYLIPKGQHTHTLVWMHGLGDSAEGYLDFFGESSSPTPDNMKVVLLTAPARKVTINMGMQMPSWFDFKAFQFNEQTFHQAIGVDEANQSAQRIHQVLNEEIAKLKGDSKKVFLGGFSQGGCMTLRAGLTFDKPLGGLLVYSGFLFPTIVDHENNKNTEILISHGEQDPLLPWAQSKQSYTKLNEQTHKVRWEIIKNLQHTFNERSLIVFSEFLKAHL